MPDTPEFDRSFYYGHMFERWAIILTLITGSHWQVGWVPDGGVRVFGPHDHMDFQVTKDVDFHAFDLDMCRYARTVLDEKIARLERLQLEES